MDLDRFTVSGGAAVRLLASNNPPTSWTKEFPKEDGHYWYRRTKEFPPIILNIRIIGDDIFVNNYRYGNNNKVVVQAFFTGEYYPIKIEPPK